jgi:CHAD domain-containing protein
VRGGLRLAARDRDLRRCDPDVVHDLRVATRRLRAVLRLYRDLLRQRDRRRLRDPLRRLGRLLGAPRQAAVSRELLMALGPELPPDLGPAAARCLGALEVRCERLCVLVRGRADARGLRRLRRRIFDVAGPLLLAGPAPAAGAPDPDLVAWVAPRLRAEVAAWRAARPQGAAPLEVWHRFRVQSKRLRYALEAGAPADAGGFGPALAALRGLQEALGRQHDHLALAADLDEVVRALARLGRPPDPALLTGARRLSALVLDRARAIDPLPATRTAAEVLDATGLG